MLPANYAYASGKLRALETKILSDTDIERMVDAPDYVTAFKVLNDTDYADNLLAVEAADYRIALHDDYRQLFDFFKQLIPDQNLFKLIFLDRDFVNLKLIFKKKYFDLEIDQLLNKNTIYSAVELKEYILNGTSKALPSDVKSLIDRVITQLGNTTSPEIIDSLLTKEYFGLMEKIAKKIHSQFISRYVKILIDNANIIVFLRAKRLNLEIKVVKDMLISGGEINTDALLKYFDEEIKTIRPLLANRYDRIIVEAFDDYCEKNLLFDFEKNLEDFKTRTVRQAKLMAYGPEVVLAYYISKLNAIANIRIIMTGKLNNIPAPAIKQTLRAVF